MPAVDFINVCHPGMGDLKYFVGWGRQPV